MKRLARSARALVIGGVAGFAATAFGADARLREVTYDPQAVIAVPVKRGVITLIELSGDEAITELAAGLGSDCARSEAVWCIASQPGGRHIFVKAKASASASNTLAVVTNRRSHAFRLDVLAERDATPPVYRLVVRQPEVAVRANAAAPMVPALGTIGVPLQAPMRPQLPEPVVIAERLLAAPQVRNAQYSLAEGKDAQDIVPTLVFDDGRFTYLRFPGNREIPAIFHVLGDGSETLVNARMEGDLVVVDRVSRQLMVRAGSAVVGIWNDAFDIEGQPPSEGMTVPGVQRAARPQPGAANAQSHQGSIP